MEATVDSCAQKDRLDLVTTHFASDGWVIEGHSGPVCRGELEQLSTGQDDLGNWAGIFPAIRFEESEGLRIRQQSLRRVWVGNRQAVVGRVEEEVVDCSSPPLPQILAENPDGKGNR
jgi:hypothetical protein